MKTHLRFLYPHNFSEQILYILLSIFAEGFRIIFLLLISTKYLCPKLKVKKILQLQKSYVQYSI